MQKLVVIPTYNEIENVRAMISKIMTLEGDYHILIVDDGSPDGTGEAVLEMQCAFTDRVFLLQRGAKLGLGTAYLDGFRWALERDYELIYEMDCDFSHNPKDLLKLTAAAQAGADVVIGSRYCSGVNVVNWPMGRLLMSYYASVYVRTITRMPVRDATAGFLCWRRNVLEAIDFDSVRMKGYGFQVEMKYTAWKLGFNIKEVSIIFIERLLGISKMSSSIFGEAFWGVFKLRFRKIKGRS